MASLSVAAISMVGLPPLAGFFSKWYLALGTVENGNWLFLGVIIVSSLLNAVYFFRILERVYMNDPYEEEQTEEEQQKAVAAATYNEPPASMLSPTVILALSLFAIGFANVIIVSALMGFFPL